MGSTIKHRDDALMNDPQIKEGYDALEQEYDIIQAMIEARKEKRITQKQLSERTGITQAEISRIENGTRNPSLEMMKRLAKGIGIVLKLEVPSEKKSSKTMYQDINADTIDRWIREGWEWGKPISHEIYEKAKNGEWDVLLTPTKPVPHEWLGELEGKRILGLASGGGQQMPVFAALGAVCTVLDYSPLQLESERLVADREGYAIRIIRGDMTKRLPFEDEEFDLIFHPVSNCYVEEVRPIWKECFRILKPGGRLLSGTDHYINYIVDPEEKLIINTLPYNPLRDPDQMKQLETEDAGVQFSHSLEEQIGGQLEAGFILRAIYEDTNGEGRLHEMNIPTFLAMYSQKPGV